MKYRNKKIFLTNQLIRMMRNFKSKRKQRKFIHFLTFLIFILSCSSVFSQIDESTEEWDSGFFGNELEYGGKIGTTVSTFTNQQPHTNIKQGVTVGAFVRYHIEEPFAVQMEVNYAQRGGRLTSFGLSGLFKAENQSLRMDNIEVPLLGQYSLPLMGGDLKLNLGPLFGFNMHSGVQSEGTMFEGTRFHTYSSEENVSSSIKNFEFSALGGVGFEFDVTDELFLIIDARYKYGLTSVYEGYSYVGIEQIQGDLKNNSMSFSVGLGF